MNEVFETQDCEYIPKDTNIRAIQMDDELGSLASAFLWAKRRAPDSEACLVSPANSERINPHFSIDTHFAYPGDWIVYDGAGLCVLSDSQFAEMYRRPENE